jgi:DNA integrity scanning protein DisA with diadenylate cyclase activity
MSFGLLAVAMIAIVVFLVAALVSVFTGTGIVRVLSNMFVALFEQYWQYVLVLGILGILGGLSYIWVV